MDGRLRSMISPGRWLTEFLILCSLVASYILAQRIASEDLQELKIFLAFAICAAFSLLILKYWRLGVVVFFVWIVFEDLLRKLSGNDMRFYFIKDALVLVKKIFLYTIGAQLPCH